MTSNVVNFYHLHFFKDYGVLLINLPILSNFLPNLPNWPYPATIKNPLNVLKLNFKKIISFWNTLTTYLKHFELSLKYLCEETTVLHDSDSESLRNWFCSDGVSLCGSESLGREFWKTPIVLHNWKVWGIVLRWFCARTLMASCAWTFTLMVNLVRSKRSLQYFSPCFVSNNSSIDITF